MRARPNHLCAAGALLVALAAGACAKHQAVKPVVDHGEATYRANFARCDGGSTGAKAAYDAAIESCGFVLQSPLATKADKLAATGNRAGLYVLTGKYAAAIDDYKQFLLGAPGDAAALLAVAGAEMKIGKCAAAVKHFDALVKLPPKPPGKRGEVLEARGDAFMCLKQYASAARDYEAAMAQKPHRAALYEKRAASFVRLGQKDAALQDYGTALEIRPQSAASLAGRAELLLAQQDYAAALADYDGATQAGLVTSDILYGSGTANLALKNYDAAITDFSRAIKLNARLAGAFAGRAQAYMRQGAYDQALQDYSHIIAMNHGAEDAYYRRGQIYQHKGNYSRAIDDYSQAIQLKPGFAKALVGRGDSYMAAGRYDLALQDFDQGSRLESGNKQLADRLRMARAELDKQIAAKGRSIEATFPKH